MDILTVLNSKDIIVKKITHHIELFNTFKKVYLFGSIVSKKRNPNDVDLLLIYEEFSSELLKDLDMIRTVFNQLYGLSFDLNVLSEAEEKESNFLGRLNSNYLRIK
ncbi:DUF6932 family protein [Edaphobacillus lindanitolerans]|uniref:Nucleotidyltransferase domain-containing protein n=1 Tax=Edaphobacillus lindanitolerans TaxID=550447 RepID=A0A1U7PIR9_9BACI|nr:nucleotidyltransferase domain-containing protein [Edaphobacillus lindanitolerans]SIT75463.1 Nucleotidyltransferase domain-containing protein [Edaphobacillus lindanitolerans]